MKSEEVMLKLVRKYGIRRAVMLFGAVSVAAARGWDAMIGDDAYSRQAVWIWKRDVEAAGIDPTKVEFSGFEHRLGREVGLGLVHGREKLRKKKAEQEARASRGRSLT